MIIVAILLKASLLLAVAILPGVLFRKRLSATSRHLLWTLAVVGLLVVPVLHAVLPVWRVTRVEAPRASQFDLAAESVVLGLASEVTSVSAPVGSGNGQPASVRITWSMLATGVYSLGVLVLLLRLAAQRLSVERLARRATRVTDPAWTDLLSETARRLNLQRSIVLLRGLEQTMPMAFGTRRPAILLPAVADTWSEDQRRSVLLHELAHVARHDCLTQSLAAVACAMYWLHPGVWWVARRLRIERELACDDRVLATGADPDDYASHLLDFAYSLRIDTAPALAVTMAAPTSLEGRLQALLDSGRNRRVPSRRSRFLATALIVGLVGAIATGRLAAMRPLLQIPDAPRQSFEVASVKPNKSAETGGFIQRMRGGSFSAGNQTLLQLIRFAYGIQGFQLVGAPAWMATERFDISARTSTDAPSEAAGPMLRSLLEDRFRLSVHRETRELPIYALVVARADGQPGPRLRRPVSDFCAKQAEAAGKPGYTPPPQGSPVCGIRGNQTQLTAGSFSLRSFAGFLAGEVTRAVVDRTGLTGVWDFDLKWSPPDFPNPDPDRPSIFTALQEQLGLRLDPTTGPVEVLVIDRLESLIPD